MVIEYMPIKKMQQLILLMGILVFFTGCSLGQSTAVPNNTNPQEIVQNDNVAQVQATAVPSTDTPQQPNPTPAPTLQPEILIQVADRYRVNGYFEEAVEAYQTILTQGDAAPEQYRVESAFRLGQSALREGLFEPAVEAMTLIIQQFPQSPRVAQAYFCAGMRILDYPNGNKQLLISNNIWQFARG